MTVHLGAVHVRSEVNLVILAAHATKMHDANLGPYKASLREFQGAQGRVRRKARRTRESPNRYGGLPLAVITSPGPPGRPSEYALGSLEFSQTSLREIPT